MRIGATGRLGIRVGIKRRLLDRRADATRPPSRADALVRVRLESDPIRAIRNASGMLRRTASRKTSAGQVEGAPEKVRRTTLADKTAAELLQYAIRLGENAPAPLRRVRVIRGMHAIVRKRSDVVGDLHWSRKNLRRDIEGAERRHVVAIEISDGARLER